MTDDRRSRFEERLQNLRAAGNEHDIVVYLDETGTPGTNEVFVSGGVLLYGDDQRIADAWRARALNKGIGRRKGNSLKPPELLEVAAFLIELPALPVAVWSKLGDAQLTQLRRASDEIARSQSPEKLVEKVSPAAWIWMRQASIAVGAAAASFLSHVGRIRTARVYADKFINQPGLAVRFLEHLQRDRLTRQRIESGAASLKVPKRVVRAVSEAVPVDWQIDLNAKGPLSQLADAVCAMFCAYRSGKYYDAWDALSLKFRREGGRVPAWLGKDITETFHEYLAEITNLAGQSP